MTESRPAENDGAQDSEYYDAMLDLLEWIWGEDYMAPGGPGNVDKLVAGRDLRGRRVLDVGSGLGGPAFYLARRYGARVVGTDLEPHLVARASARAQELGLSEQVEFRVVEAGPMDFPNGHFDLVLSSGAITQTADKLGIFSEIFRVLKPGGALSCYDWMKSEGEYSADMLEWFRLEGLTYAMATLEQHGEILAQAGFVDIELEDASDWYRRECKKEHALLKGEGYSTIVDLIGKEDADHLIESWRVMVIICENGEMRQGYCRADKPLRTV
jgi:phosphoethanolamine N-methyltransferase